MQTISNIREYFINELRLENFTVDRLGDKTIEMIGASFLADEPAIFGEPNKEYIDREIDWYMRMSTNITDIYGKEERQPPKAWQYAADRFGNINSNYGKLIFDEKFYHQYDMVVQELEANPDTRRACMVYNRPSIWTEYNEDGKDDFICTNAVTYYLREAWARHHTGDIQRLDCVVQMRSNDVIFGYRNDWVWQQHILKELSEDLGEFTAPGKMIWQVQNLHVYEKHFDLVSLHNEYLQ